MPAFGKCDRLNILVGCWRFVQLKSSRMRKPGHNFWNMTTLTVDVIRKCRRASSVLVFSWWGDERIELCSKAIETLTRTYFLIGIRRFCLAWLRLQHIFSMNKWPILLSEMGPAPVRIGLVLCLHITACLWVCYIRLQVLIHCMACRQPQLQDHVQTQVFFTRKGKVGRCPAVQTGVASYKP